MMKTNNQIKSSNHLLHENLEYKDLEGMMKPTIHVDEFASKMGDDADIIVLSFFVRSQTAARDLMNWFEKGYDWVMDSDTSPGEIKPGRYLVYVEIRRRNAAGRWTREMIQDLGTLTEFEPDDWTMHYDGQSMPFNQENFDKTVPLSPKEYRQIKETGINEMRVAAGLEPRRIHEIDSNLRSLQAAAGI